MRADFKVKASKETIIKPQTNIPKMGTNGTKGVLKGRGTSGLVFLMIKMPAQTNTNANKVPNDVRSPARLPGAKPANNPTKTKRIQLALKGVLYLG